MSFRNIFLAPMYNFDEEDYEFDLFKILKKQTVEDFKKFNHNLAEFDSPDRAH